MLDAATRGLVRVALGLYGDSDAQLGEAMRVARADGASPLWLEELLLASVLYVGFPRAIVAWTVYRRLEPAPAPGSEPSSYERWREWSARGEETCRAIYRKHYAQLRHNVGALHPALEQWMLVDGYGKTLSRAGLDLMRRELCSIAMIVAQDAPRQLLSHLQGALNAGAAPAQVDAVLALAATAPVARERLEIARGLWQELKDTLGHD